ncbi:MAG: hypothetical protein KAR14_01875 [Candidatus Aminicenantes bacterium]|nr:hypothetical protein [Candidatus Aminicenantes bacterium]
MDINSLNSELEKWKPGVSKNILLLVAGLLWIVIGIFLNFRSYSWLRDRELIAIILIVTSGLFLSVLIHTFGFSKIVNKNIQRIIPMDGKRCLFSFLPWRSYVLISVMILMGSFIRHSAIPKIYLSFIYTGIGTAMILSGSGYLRVFRRVVKK